MLPIFFILNDSFNRRPNGIKGSKQINKYEGFCLSVDVYVVEFSCFYNVF